MKLKTFTIIEKKWARGGKGGRSSLCNQASFKCCLGFMCQRLGARSIRGYDFPDELPDILEIAPSLASGSGQIVCREIGVVNDDGSINDAERKTILADLFQKIGWKPVYK